MRKFKEKGYIFEMNINRLFFWLAYLYGHYSPIRLRRFRICMKILSVGGVNPWQNTVRFRELISRIPDHIVHIKNGIAFNCILKDTTHLPMFFTIDIINPEIIEFYNKIIFPGAVVIDVGANTALHSLLLANLAGPKGRIYAFECVPETLDKARRNIMLNQNSDKFAPIELIPLALGSKEGITNIYLTESASGEDVDSGTGSFISGFHDPEGRRVTEVPVKVVKLDNYLGQLSGISRIDFIKCDIEGGEWEFFLGSRKTIEKFKPILLFEWNPGQMTYDGIMFSKALADYGYHPFLLRDIISILRNRDLATFCGDVAFYPKSYIIK